MGLENLKSIFNEDVPKESYAGTFSNLSLSSTFPILDTILVQAPFFVSPDLLLKYYDNMPFDPRPPKNKGITITNVNPYKGTTYIATNPTDFSSAASDGLYTPQALPYPLLPERLTPILDTLLIQSPFFVSQDLHTKYYDGMTFDPRIPKNEGITITNVNPYMGTQYTATNPTNFSTAGVGKTHYTPYSVPFQPYPSTSFDIPTTPDGEGGNATATVNIATENGIIAGGIFPGQSPVWSAGDNYITDFVDRLPYPESSFDNNGFEEGFTLERLSVPPNGINILNPGQAPELDRLWPNINSQPPFSAFTDPDNGHYFVNSIDDGIANHPFRTKNFDPRTAKNTRITITPNVYVGTKYIPTNPTDFSTAGDGESPYTPYSVPFKTYPETSFDNLLTGEEGAAYNTTVVDTNTNTLVPGNSPLLDIFWPETTQPPLGNTDLPYDSDFFVDNIDAAMTDEVGNPNHPFLNKTFDPRTAKNTGIQIGQVNPYPGTKFASLNPNHFETAGIEENSHTPLSSLGIGLGDSKGWESLYTSHHQSIATGNESDTTQFKPYHYGINVQRDNLSIRYEPGGDIGGTSNGTGFSRHTYILGLDSLGQLLSSRSTQLTREPYIISPIPKGGVGINGRFLNAGSRELPVMRSLTDTFRISRYLASNQGVLNIALKNIYTLLAVPVTAKHTAFKRSKGSLSLLHKGSRRAGQIFSNTAGHANLDRSRQRYNNNLAYNPLHTLLSISPAARLIGINTPNLLTRSGGLIDTPFGNLAGGGYYERTSGKVWASISGTGTTRTIAGLWKDAIGEPRPTIEGGDEITLYDPDSEKHKYDPTQAEPFKHKKLDTAASSFEKGLPLYFIDLRNNKVVYFRGYLDGITENIAPSWAESNYVGRSEPVYVYERASRDISFNLKLFGHTPAELTRIYQKMNRLTSMCYPEYANDDYLGNQKTKMKPPLTKFRLGELYGGRHTPELTGFIKSLTYTVPEESTWEGVQSWKGRFSDPDINRVPKFVIATINYQVIHDNVPNMNTLFYGYKTKQAMADVQTKDGILGSFKAASMNNPTT